MPVEPVDGHVTGGMTESLLQLGDLRAMTLLPAGTPTPPHVVAVPVRDATFPLRAIWPAGRPPAVLAPLRARLGAS